MSDTPASDQDLKGAAPSTVVGRRICVWYEHEHDVADDDEPPLGPSGPQPSEPPQPQPQPGAIAAPPDEPAQHPPAEPAPAELKPELKPALGVVSYFCEAGRLHVVFDGDDESDGWWVDRALTDPDPNLNPNPSPGPNPILTLPEPSPRWVDERDEWGWADESLVGPAPRPLPVPGCWRSHAATGEAGGEAGEAGGEAGEVGGVGEAGDEAGLGEPLGAVERIFLVRTRHTKENGEAADQGSRDHSKGEARAVRAGELFSSAAETGPERLASAPAPATSELAGSTAETGPELELLVKWKGLAHVHSQWVPRSVVEGSGPMNRRKVARFVNQVRLALPEGAELEAVLSGPRVVVASADGLLAEGEDAYNPAYREVERVISRRAGAMGGTPEFLVKWRGLPYASATWEGCMTMLGFQSAIHTWRERARAAPTPAELAVAARAQYRPPAAHFRPLLASPAYKGGRTLRTHQVEGLNWLLFSWYQRRNVMLADEMGLGKTAQAIALLEHLWKAEHVRGPFLVVAPLSTLAHWQREVEDWTDLDVLLYHGSRESRELMLRHEFYADGGLTADGLRATSGAMSSAAAPPLPPKGGGGYRCGRCGQLKKGHVCSNPLTRAELVGEAAGEATGEAAGEAKAVAKVEAATWPSVPSVLSAPHAPPSALYADPLAPPHAPPPAPPPAPTRAAVSRPPPHAAPPAPPRHRFQVLLTSYETLRDDFELLGAIPWRVMVVDEAHRLKNKDSAVAAELRAVKAEHTLMLTGTPLQNNVGTPALERMPPTHTSRFTVTVARGLLDPRPA